MAVEPGQHIIEINRGTTYEENFTLDGQGWTLADYDLIELQARDEPISIHNFNTPPETILTLNNSTEGGISVIDNTFTITIPAEDTLTLPFNKVKYGIALMKTSVSPEIKHLVVEGSIIVSSGRII